MSADTWPTEAMVEAAARALWENEPTGGAAIDDPLWAFLAGVVRRRARKSVAAALDAAPKGWGTRWPDGGYLLADSETEARDDHADAVAHGHDTEIVHRVVGPWTREDTTDAPDA